jgi:hypothetical protein
MHYPSCNESIGSVWDAEKTVNQFKDVWKSRKWY